jgi:hypothetical protein
VDPQHVEGYFDGNGRLDLVFLSPEGAESGGIRTLIPEQTVQRFRCKPYSPGIRSAATLDGLDFARWVRGVKAGFSSHGTSFELDVVSVVNEAIQDGIGEGGVGDVVVPVIDGELAGHESGRLSYSKRSASIGLSREAFLAG